MLADLLGRQLVLWHACTTRAVTSTTNSVEAWLESRIGIRESTRSAHESYLRSLIVPYLGDYPLDAIQPDDLRRWVATLDRDGSAPATISKAPTIVRKVLDRAVVDRRIAANPAVVGDLDAPTTRRRSMTTLTAAEVVALVDAAGPLFGTHLYTAATTGQRWGELAGLEVDNLDLLRGEIHVVSQLREVSGDLTLGAPPKTGSSRRTVTIGRDVAHRIGEHMGQFPSESGVVFTSAEGRLLRRSNFGRRILKPAAEAIGKPGLRFHDLRHTHASLLLAAGEPIPNVAARLGHANASTTLRIYAHAIEGTERSAADRIESVLAGVPRDVALRNTFDDVVKPLRG